MLFVDGVQLVVILGLHIIFLYLSRSLCRNYNLSILQRSEREQYYKNQKSNEHPKHEKESKKR